MEGEQEQEAAAAAASLLVDPELADWLTSLFDSNGATGLPVDDDDNAGEALQQHHARPPPPGKASTNGM